jgi:VanZ family protein
MAAILWMGVIFYFSSLPDLKSDLPSIWDFIFRKLAHMFEYAVLYALWWRSLVGCRNRVMWAFALTIGYSISDEFHQSFVHGRVASPIDVGIDICGMVVGYAVLKYKIPHHSSVVRD